MKQLIGIFRIALLMVLAYVFKLPILDPFEIKIMISKLVHSGQYTSEFRDSLSVNLIMFVILGLMCFYILQSLIYIFLGHALEGKRTGLFRFLGYVVSGLRECARDPYFWTRSSGSDDFSRLEDVLKYRDNKMAFMDNKRAAEYMKGTGHIEHLMNRKDLKQSQKTLSYLNNKVAFMDNERALDYLRGKKGGE